MTGQGEPVDIDDLLASLVIKWRGREWDVSPGVPLSVLTMARDIEDFDMRRPEHAVILVAGLLRVPVEEIEALDPTHAELAAILMQIAQHVGMPAGELRASSPLPDVPASPSRPTSNASTTSTSSPNG